MPRLEAFRPQMLFFFWITEQVIMGVAARHAEGRIVSVLEGGCDLSALGRSVAAHIKTMAGL